ncbi:amidohydrolase [Saccharibacillus sp. O23]|uniref:amidohydrolase family protein n=1 Tax=Saccharibacillus sp. O23 TaxID=2009338 RepID=UPI0015C67E2D|nr:amidohydrolase family protein [Saccharibacillus sp. O23]
MRIDAHQHFWKIERNDYGWITPEIPVLYRDFLPDDLRPELREQKIDATVLVQAAPTLEETEYILELAAHEPFVAGVVGWLDPEHPDFREQYNKLREHPKFVGLRVMIQEMEDSAKLLSPPFLQALSLFAEEDLPVDLLVLPHQLPHLEEMLDRVPGLRGVVDHLAKPPIASGEIEPWRSRMAEIARHPGICCKLSGMVTEAAADWKAEDFRTYIETVLELFGPERIMFGSDWPVCLTAATYADTVELLLGALRERLSAEEIDAAFGTNAARFYKLNFLSDGGAS